MGPLAILWDIENCPVPGEANAEDVAANLRMALRVHPAIKGSVTMFSAYGDFNFFPRKVREGCQRTGVNLIDVPNVKKDASDKAILVDMFLFALDNPPPCTIFLISGDVDFASALHKLGQRGYTILLAIPSGVAVASTLCSAGRYVWDWPSVARGEGLVPAKAFHSCEGNGALSTRQGSGSFGSDDSDQSKDEFTLPELSKRSVPRKKGPYALRNCDCTLNNAELDQYRSFKPMAVKGANMFPCAVESRTMANALDPSARFIPTNPFVPLNCRQPADARGFENPSVIDRGTEAVQPEESNDCVELTSPGAISQTSWVQPGDLEGLKRQLVKLLSLHGGRLVLPRLPAEYSRTFGRPLYLAEYKSLKLAHLIERMRDTFLVKGEGNGRTLHLTKAGMCIASKYKDVWGTCTLKNNTKGHSVSKKRAQKGCSYPASAYADPKALENREISGSSPDSDSSSADEKGVDREEREEITDFDIQSTGVALGQPDVNARLEAFKSELQELLVSHACKILVNSFLALYQLRYSRWLDYRALGFQTLESLFEKVQDIAVLEEEQGSGEMFVVAKCATK